MVRQFLSARFVAAALLGSWVLTSAAEQEQEDLQAYWSGDELPYTLYVKPRVEVLILEPGHKSHSQVAHQQSSASSSAFIVHAVALLAAVFVLMYVYGKTYATIEALTGIKLTHVCCIVYATLSISIDLSIKNAAEAYGGHFPFNPACGVIVVEYCKFIVSAVLFAKYVYEANAAGQVVAKPRSQDVMWLSVPAAIYAMNNLIVFQAIRSTPLATFGVVRETMLIWNAFIWTATFGHPLSTQRWMAIAGIFLGCSLNQIPKMMHDEWSSGVLWSMLLAFSNAAGAVANEYAMKQRAQLDINMQNAILYTLCGSFVLMGLIICDPAVVASPSAFFSGFVPECWQVILLQVFTGLAVSRILKYVEAVTKTIVAAIRGPGVIIIGAVIFSTSLGASEILATVIVCASCYLFLSQGPLVKPVEKKGEPCETDKLMKDDTPVQVKV